MTDLVLLSGFLGAGKTTLLRRMLDALKSDGAQVGVVSNDFGAVNIDSELISADGPVIEITNGSLFCSCREHDFVEGLKKLSAYSLDYVLVEASGLGDPANLGDLLTEAIREWPELNYLGTVCVVDAEEVVELADLLQVVPRQIAYADVILANKADLVGSGQLLEVTRWIESQNPRIEVIGTVRCDVPPQRLLTRLAHSQPAGHDETTNTCESRMTSVWLACGDDMSEAGLRTFLADIAPLTHRIKGLVRCAGKTAEVSCVHRRVEIITNHRPARNPGLVLMTSQGSTFHSRLVRSWEEHIQLPMQLA